MRLPVILGYRVYPAGGAENFIRQSLKELTPYVSGVIVTVSEKPWHGSEYPHDQTLSIISKVSIEEDSPEFEVVTKNWKDENEQGSWLLSRAFDKYPGMYLLMIDCDEVITKKTLEEGLKAIGDKPALMFYHRCYWWLRELKILPDFHVSALGLIKLDKQRKMCRFRHLEVEDYAYLPVEKGFCHHFAYVRTDEQMKQKISSFSHANEIVTNWFEEKWKSKEAIDELKNFHPVVPEKWTGLEEVEQDTLPESVRR